MADTSFLAWKSEDGSEEEWLSYSYYSLEKNQNSYFPDAYTCTGHEATDRVLPSRLSYLPDFPSLADVDNDGIITNWEYFIAADPNNIDGVDYVYDNFEWSHCVDTLVKSGTGTYSTTTVKNDEEGYGGYGSSGGGGGGGSGGGGGGEGDEEGGGSSDSSTQQKLN